ncbi:hypothetical protein ACJX0J_013780, partial [Zea mays]
MPFSLTNITQRAHILHLRAHKLSKHLHQFFWYITRTTDNLFLLSPVFFYGAASFSPGGVVYASTTILYIVISYILEWHNGKKIEWPGTGVIGWLHIHITYTLF